MIEKDEVIIVMEEAINNLSNRAFVPQNKIFEFTYSKILMEDPRRYEENPKKEDCFINCPNILKGELHVLYKKTNLGDLGKIDILRKIGKIYGYDLILRKKVQFTEKEYEEKNADTIMCWVQHALELANCGVSYFKKDNKNGEKCEK